MPDNPLPRVFISYSHDARENIAAAATLIQQTGYHRRDVELAELQETVAP